MERKVSRRGPHPDHLHLDKSMISGPTNFSHVGRSDPFRDRLGEWAEGETQVGGGVKDHRWAEVSEEERQEREGEGEQGGEYDPCPVSPPSPNTERRSSRRISKDMISLPMNFRHVLHIDPSSADPEHLSLLLKSGTEMEYDLECDEEEEEEEEEEEQQEEEEEEENENEDPAWPPPEPPVDYHEGTKGAPDPAPAKPRALRPSNRVRKSMISLPTNFQHVNHISAGERLLAPESPPPQVPPEPQPGGEGHEGKEWRYKTSPCTPPVIPFPPPPQISQILPLIVILTPQTCISLPHPVFLLPPGLPPLPMSISPSPPITPMFLPLSLSPRVTPRPPQPRFPPRLIWARIEAKVT
ncbi:pollen-specific leucine-rich repeat extensin-like protein 2 isoform X1 [Portunus trituberculatus]|uniref:pollen-specific leucine-rich repeat extensin-like protein 2 isoform X1 n=1 Tax=Portunus trituberculatus TaxID=210409 RepID=UPI001E1CC65A|nr:pollen-specific leucine-rich repeat extensin-like protein 2 isoform X1 [Portunus trituberculatus]XP_045125024.1 pollen-specific leucine-rich repeat extensin-like protein 2 isoform X1 [Portunus trituberculatus]XP_045125025.1 pollen-specific leucine-rich repeat extensin-like protein 2 isoform X1 [Portunus trituberculatus]XP_045125026.1 pollen-specific leucine-rich repeat extensin-like protein 2 isoform X1 [Portunus trituberculatus]XP_045125027.1 pollen-specific leucine-rich repeat extensin-lik